MATTRPFRTTSGDYFGVVLGAWFRKRGWVLLIPVVATLALGIVLGDERWMLMALMLIFIVAPMAMSFIYTYYMLTPEARRAVLPKRIEVDEGKSLKLIYLHDADIESPDTVKKPAQHADNVIEIEEAAPEHPLPEPETISWNRIKKITYTSRFRVYHLHGSHMQFILIPHTAVPHE